MKNHGRRTQALNSARKADHHENRSNAPGPRSWHRLRGFLDDLFPPGRRCARAFAGPDPRPLPCGLRGAGVRHYLGRLPRRTLRLEREAASSPGSALSSTTACCPVGSAGMRLSAPESLARPGGGGNPRVIVVGERTTSKKNRKGERYDSRPCLWNGSRPGERRARVRSTKDRPTSSAPPDAVKSSSRTRRGSRTIIRRAAGATADERDSGPDLMRSSWDPRLRRKTP